MASSRAKASSGDHLLQTLLQTPELRAVVGDLLPALLGVWAEERLEAHRLTRPLARRFHRRRKPFRSADGARPQLGRLLPEVLDRLLAAVEEGLAGAAGRAPAERETWLAETLSKWGRGGSGRLLTRLAALIHQMQDHNPTVLAEAAAPVVERWLTATDFGRLRELADGMGPEVLALAKAVNDLLWRYPGKLVLCLSFLPDLLNAMVAFGGESVGRFNRAAPDLVADIALSLLDAVDGQSAGRVLDEAARLAAGLSSGSSLIGDPGRTRLSVAADRLVGEVLDELDPRSYWRARVALAEGRETLGCALWEACAERPAFVLEGLRSFADRHNPRLRAAVKRLAELDALEETALAEALDGGLDALEMQAAGEAVTLFCELVGRAVAQNPERAGQIGERFAAAVDMEALAVAVTGALRASAAPLRPLWRSLLPVVVTEGCRVLAPADDGREAEAAAARQALRALLREGGEAR